jgi:hypothetical protein
MLQDLRPVHTLNARGHMLLEIVRAEFNLDGAAMLREIQALRREVEEVLGAKGISYDALRPALVPSQKRREIALVFDSTAIDDNFYGRQIFNRYMPLFDARSDHSVLVGDYGTLDDNDEPLLAKALHDTVAPVRPVKYRHSSQFFIVYINNLSNQMFTRFDAGLRPFAGYVGHADMTYGSTFKILLSTMLANGFIKHGRTLIQPHEGDRSNGEDINPSLLDFETLGYTCRSISDNLAGPLLSYKIERPVIDYHDTDTEMALNAVSIKPLPLGDFTICVDEAKAAYARTHNAAAIARAGIDQISASELGDLIASKIRASYIYRLEYQAAFDITKFNVILELSAREGRQPVRLLATLEYRPDNQVLKLITLF